MYNTKLLKILCKVWSWAIVAGAFIGTIYACWLAGSGWDFAEGMGMFIGAEIMVLLYASFLYLIVAALYKYLSK